MNRFVKVSNNTVVSYPYTMAQLRKDHPNVSFTFAPNPADLEDFGLRLVQLVPQPAPQVGHKVVEGTPVLVGNQWTQVWNQEPLSTEELAAQRAEKIDAIKTERDRRTQQGGFKVGTDWFHSDLFSRVQQIGLTMAGGGIPPGLQWKTMTGAKVSMNQSKSNQLFAAAMASDVAIFSHAENLIAQVNAAQYPETVDITAGWPEMFGDSK